VPDSKLNRQTGWTRAFHDQLASKYRVMLHHLCRANMKGVYRFASKDTRC
jgi:hypothetical protein